MMVDKESWSIVISITKWKILKYDSENIDNNFFGRRSSPYFVIKKKATLDWNKVVC